MPRGRKCSDERQIEIAFPGVPAPVVEPALPKPRPKRRSAKKAKRRRAPPRRARARPVPRPVIFAPIIYAPARILLQLHIGNFHFLTALKVSAIGFTVFIIGTSFFSHTIAPEPKACLPPNAAQWG